MSMHDTTPVREPKPFQPLYNLWLRSMIWAWAMPSNTLDRTKNRFKRKLVNVPPWAVRYMLFILIMTLLGHIGTLMYATRLDFPLAMVSVRADLFTIRFAARRADLVFVIICASARMLLTDPIWYKFGWRGSDWILDRARPALRPRKWLLMRGIARIRYWLATFSYGFLKHISSLRTAHQNGDSKMKQKLWAAWRLIMLSVVYFLVFVWGSGYACCTAGILRLNRVAVACLAVSGTVLKVYAIAEMGWWLFL